MTLLKIIVRKLAYEFDGLVALLRYTFRKHEIMNRLASSMPMIQIETTNICNADCVFCGYQFQTRPTGVMPRELYKKIIDEYCDLGGGAVELTPTVGDPLVDPDALWRIQYARSKPQISKIYMISNMISLERIGAEALVESGLSQLSVSMSGFDPEMYSRVYRSKQYPRVLRNVKAFAIANNERGRPVEYHIDMRIDRPLKEVFASPDLQDVAKLVGIGNIGVKFRYDSWAGLIKQEALPGTMRLRKHQGMLRPRISPCTEMFKGPAVFWDGKVGGCGCRDVDASALPIGNVATEGLRDIWFGKAIREFRDKFRTSKGPEICRDCTHYNNLSLLLRKEQRAHLASIKPCTAAPSIHADIVHN